MRKLLFSLFSFIKQRNFDFTSDSLTVLQTSICYKKFLAFCDKINDVVFLSLFNLRNISCHHILCYDKGLFSKQNFVSFHRRKNNIINRNKILFLRRTKKCNSMVIWVWSKSFRYTMTFFRKPFLYLCFKKYPLQNLKLQI